MSQSTSNVNITTDTFNSWVTKTNELRFALNSVIVTANSTLGNTSGNCHVSGFFAANTLVAVEKLRGGSIAANGSGLPQISTANLAIDSNTVFQANVYLDAGTTLTDAAIGTHSNTHVFNSNVTANGTHLIIGTATRLFANGGAGSSGQVLTSNGTTVHWTTPSSVTVLDSVSNTSATIAAAANSVKTAYDAAVVGVYTFGSRTYNANLVANGSHFIVSTGTRFFANGGAGSSGQVLTSNGTGVYWGTTSSSVTVVDSVSNTSTTAAAAANSAKTAYDVGIAANTLANTAQTNALNANTRAFSAQTAAATAQTDALNANTRAFSAQTAATAAYSNAIAFSANATNLTNGTVPVARLSGTYSISIDGSAGSVAWTSVTGRPTDLASFTNGPGYVTSSGSVSHATTADTATSASSVAWGNVTGTGKVLNHVSTGYNSARVFVQAGTPSSPSKGDIWFDI